MVHVCVKMDGTLMQIPFVKIVPNKLDARNARQLPIVLSVIVSLTGLKTQKARENVFVNLDTGKMVQLASHAIPKHSTVPPASKMAHAPLALTQESSTHKKPNVSVKTIPTKTKQPPSASNVIKTNNASTVWPPKITHVLNATLS